MKSLPTLGDETALSLTFLPEAVQGQEVDQMVHLLVSLLLLLTPTLSTIGDHLAPLLALLLPKSLRSNAEDQVSGAQMQRDLRALLTQRILGPKAANLSRPVLPKNGLRVLGLEAFEEALPAKLLALQKMKVGDGQGQSHETALHVSITSYLSVPFLNQLFQQTTRPLPHLNSPVVSLSFSHVPMPHLPYLLLSHPPTRHMLYRPLVPILSELPSMSALSCQ